MVSKSDNNVHATFTLDMELRDLAPSSIRVRIFLISLTSNNLSYARLGDFMHWLVFSSPFFCVLKMESLSLNLLE